MQKGQSQAIIKQSESTLLKMDKTNEKIFKAVRVGNEHLLHVMTKGKDDQKFDTKFEFKDDERVVESSLPVSKKSNYQPGAQRKMNL
jgi:hypothetical protein